MYYLFKHNLLGMSYLLSSYLDYTPLIAASNYLTAPTMLLRPKLNLNYHDKSNDHGVLALPV